MDKFGVGILMTLTLKQFNVFIGVVQFFRNFFHNLGKKSVPFDRFFRTENTFTITNDHRDSLTTIKSVLTAATNVTVRLAKLGLLYIIICDSGFHGIGFVLMIEDHLIDQKGKKKKISVQVTFP